MKNGETVTVEIPTESVSIDALSKAMKSEPVTIPSGNCDLYAELRHKVGVWSTTLEIVLEPTRQVPTPPTPTPHNPTPRDPAQPVIIICPQCSAKLRVPSGNAKIKVTCPKCQYSFFWPEQPTPNTAHDAPVAPSPAPKDQKTPEQVQARRHASRVTELAGQYLKTGSEPASEELVDLYEVTDRFYKQQIDGYEGVMAIHAHILALRYVNEAYNPSKALAYAHIAELGYTEYLRTLSPEEQKTTKLYLYQVWQILAYVDYVNDNRHGARQWMEKIPAQEIGVSGIALIATVLFRLACEEGRNELFPRAFNLFQGMDKVFTEPARFSFEEDILRAAYGFYEMYYGDKNVGQQVSVTYDPSRSVAILMRAWNLLKDPQQKAWLKEDIDKALEKTRMDA